MSSFIITGRGKSGMRILIYIIAIANVVLGFTMIFRENDPFKGKTYEDIAKKEGKDS